MEHPFFPTTTTRAEALRWLAISEKLLSARDLLGSKSFATRALDSDPTFSPADQILAIIDTLLAGDRRIGNNQPDWYAILRLTPTLQGQVSELITSRYRSLVLLLNPQGNKFNFADEAFRLVTDAWSILSDPLRKSMYDKELAFYLQQQQKPDPFSSSLPTMQQNFMFFGGAAAANSVAQSLMHVGRSGSSGGGGLSYFPQLQQVNAAKPQIEPMVNGSTREPRHFMTFNSSPGFVFGSGSKSSHEPVSKLVQETFSGLPGGYIASASVINGEVMNKNPQEKYLNASDDYNIHNMNLSENGGEVREDEPRVEGVVEEEEEEEEKEERVHEPANDGDRSTFWTACPYCYYMYEYPNMYADCTLRCQNCKMAFQGVAIPSPPPVVDEQKMYFCCWGYLPLGFSMDIWKKNKAVATSWTPFSYLFTSQPLPLENLNNVNKKRGGWNSGPRIYMDDDEIYEELSDSDESSDYDWHKGIEKRRKMMKKAKKVKQRAIRTPNKGKHVNVQDGVDNMVNTTGEPCKNGSTTNSRKQPDRVAKYSGRVAKNSGNLDLNVELSNEAEESARRGNKQGRGEEDTTEGNGFFEGLDEFLNSLPILNGVSDEKAA